MPQPQNPVEEADTAWAVTPVSALDISLCDPSFAFKTELIIERNYIPKEGNAGIKAFTFSLSIKAFLKQPVI